MLVELSAEEVVIVLGVFVQKIEKLIDLWDVACFINLIFAKQLIKLILKVFLVFFDAFFSVLIHNNSFIKLSLIPDVIFGSVDLLVLVVYDLLNEFKYAVLLKLLR